MDEHEKYHQQEETQRSEGANKVHAEKVTTYPARGKSISMHPCDQRDAARRELARVCEWKLDGDGAYYVKCGDFRVGVPMQLDVDGAAYHRFKFCPYCGGKLIVKINTGV